MRQSGLLGDRPQAGLVGASEFFITIDTGKCDSCGDCVKACPAKVIELAQDPLDPLSDALVPVICEAHRKKIKYSCAPCKPISDRLPLPCIAACKSGAIKHSW